MGSPSASWIMTRRNASGSARAAVLVVSGVPSSRVAVGLRRPWLSVLSGWRWMTTSVSRLSILLVRSS